MASSSGNISFFTPIQPRQEDSACLKAGVFFDWVFGFCAEQTAKITKCGDDRTCTVTLNLVEQESTAWKFARVFLLILCVLTLVPLVLKGLTRCLYTFQPAEKVNVYNCQLKKNLSTRQPPKKVMDIVSEYLENKKSSEEDLEVIEILKKSDEGKIIYRQLFTEKTQYCDDGLVANILSSLKEVECSGGGDCLIMSLLYADIENAGNSVTREQIEKYGSVDQEARKKDCFENIELEIERIRKCIADNINIEILEYFVSDLNESERGLYGLNLGGGSDRDKYLNYVITPKNPIGILELNTYSILRKKPILALSKIYRDSNGYSYYATRYGEEFDSEGYIALFFNDQEGHWKAMVLN